MTPTQLQTALTEIRETCVRVLALADTATQGPWITGSIPWKVWANGGYNTVCDVKDCGDSVPIPDMPGLATSNSMAANRDFIASSRTFDPRAARGIIAVLDVLEPGLKSPNAYIYSTSHLALTALASQWLEGKR